MITDHFQAKSILAWAPGWLQSDPGFSKSLLSFWIVNFGLTLPLMIALFGVVVWCDVDKVSFRWQLPLPLLTANAE